MQREFLRDIVYDRYNNFKSTQDFADHYDYSLKEAEDLLQLAGQIALRLSPREEDERMSFAFEEQED